MPVAQYDDFPEDDEPLAIATLTKDLREAAKTMGRREARYLVDTYYTLQEHRMATAKQMADTAASGEPHATLAFVSDQFAIMEMRVKSLLDIYSKNQELGKRIRAVKGIGPVIAAGLLANIDMEPWRCARVTAKTKACHPEESHGPECRRERIETVGHIWRFAGLDPTTTWDKGEKRPWNARLKVLCWKIGESFVKVSGREDALYGRLYAQRKGIELAKNEAGAFADQAKAALSAKRYGVDTVARKWYEEGKLPPAHIHARAKRWAVKLFLAYYHREAYRLHFGAEPPKPYPIAILGHAHEVWPTE